MSGLADNFLLDPLLRQPFLGPEGEDDDNELIATVAVSPPELDIRSFDAIVVLCLVKSEAVPLHKELGLSTKDGQVASAIVQFMRPALHCHH